MSQPLKSETKAGEPAKRAAARIHPAHRYPRPPFADQKQPWPGLAREMKPKPDHGEESYVGSGRLTGRKALVTVVVSALPAMATGPIRPSAL